MSKVLFQNILLGILLLKGRMLFAQKDSVILSNGNTIVGSIAKAGAGKYRVHTNKSYFSLGGGVSSNNESFTNGTPKQSSWEGYFGTKVNVFDIGDFSLSNDVFAYPSLTESVVGGWTSILIRGIISRPTFTYHWAHI